MGERGDASRSEKKCKKNALKRQVSMTFGGTMSPKGPLGSGYGARSEPEPDKDLPNHVDPLNVFVGMNAALGTA